jgi:hypothetical protein
MAVLSHAQIGRTPGPPAPTWSICRSPDGNLITSRKPDDILAFADALIAALERKEVRETA